jgi:hypothetical protein
MSWGRYIFIEIITPTYHIKEMSLRGDHQGDEAISCLVSAISF